MSGAWMTTATGKDYFLTGAEQVRNEIDIYDIAHALAQINRYTGHASRPISVGEHSVLTADLARHDGKGPLIQLACLMHDAHEVFTGDLGSPQKQAVGLAWSPFEALQANHVRRHFGLTTVFAVYGELIHHYDMVALATERRDLVRYDPRHNLPWVIDAPGRCVPPASWVNLNALERVNATWSHWRQAFLERFFQLQREIESTNELLTRQAVFTGATTPST